MACKKSQVLSEVKLFLCALCARAMKLQELFFKDNNCRDCQSQVSRIKIPGFTKAQDYSDVYPMVIRHYVGFINLDSEYFLCTRDLVFL